MKESQKVLVTGRFYRFKCELTSEQGSKLLTDFLRENDTCSYIFTPIRQPIELEKQGFYPIWYGSAFAISKNRLLSLVADKLEGFSDLAEYNYSCPCYPKFFFGQKFFYLRILFQPLEPEEVNEYFLYLFDSKKYGYSNDKYYSESKDFANLIEIFLSYDDGKKLVKKFLESEYELEILDKTFDETIEVFN